MADPRGSRPVDTVLSRAQSGELAAFEELVGLHERLVLRVAAGLVGREEARDAAQEVFLRLYRGLKKLPADVALNAWLYRVTVNHCRDVLRKRSESAALDERLRATGPSPESLSDFDQRRRILSEGLKTLGDKERAAIVLRDVEGLSNREIAGVLGSTESTVRSQVCLARTKLRTFAEKWLRRRT